eukprot:503024-Rhodomonas_salina.2
MGYRCTSAATTRLPSSAQVTSIPYARPTCTISPTPCVVLTKLCPMQRQYWSTPHAMRDTDV